MNDMDERPDNYCMDDEVWIDNDPKAVRGAYHQKAGRVYYISRIDTREVCSVTGIFLFPNLIFLLYFSIHTSIR